MASSVDLLLRRFARKMIPHSLILLYHRVADNGFDPQLLSVSPKNFSDHMEVLRSTCHPISLAKLSGRKLLNVRSPCNVVVTFDDGYADNFLNAKPILEQNEIPATVFVSTGFIGNKQVPYWDELANIILQTPSLPPNLTLLVDGEIKSWKFAGESSVDGSWNVLQECKRERQNAYKSLCDRLQSLPSNIREDIMVKIRAWAVTDGTVAANNQFMTVEQLRQLTVGGLIDVGAHTVTHPNLAALPVQAQRNEIVEGRRQLEEMTGQKVNFFAYPYGGRPHYTSETIRLIKEQGFACACSNFGGRVWPYSDRYQLPRVLVRNWTADEFVNNIISDF